MAPPDVPWNDVSVLTVNTNGVKKNGHLLVTQLLAKHSVSCIQETKFRDAKHAEAFRFHLDANFSNKLFINDAGSTAVGSFHARRWGVMTILRSDFPGFETAQSVEGVGVVGRYLVVKVVVNGAAIYVHNVYAPVEAAAKALFFGSLDTACFEDNATHIVAGDLNTALNPSVDASATIARSDAGRAPCLAWLSMLGVVDAWRIHHPDDRIYTGPQPRCNRLDYVLVSEQFVNDLYANADYIAPNHAGDHLAHRVFFRSAQQLQGRGYWKFPSHLLEYPEVVAAIEAEANELLDRLRVATNPGLHWDRWKNSIRVKLQRIQQKLRVQTTGAIDVARRALDAAAALWRQQRDDFSHDAFHSALDAYRDCVKRSSCYNQDSAFDFQAHHAERSSKYFFRPLDPTLRRVTIEEVTTVDGGTSTDPHVISDGFLNHWGRIMGDEGRSGGPTPAPNPRHQQSLLDSLKTRLSMLEREVLNAPLTAEDLTAALKHMRGTSTPGLDGLTAGFYQVAPSVFGECLCIVFNYQLERGLLAPSQRRSAICLLHKKGARTDPGNYRPIALMQVDVKALSKVLTYRLQAVLPKLIHEDQKAFVRGRSMHHHVRSLVDLQSLTTVRDEEAYATFLDFEKAYDRVDWHYMFKVLNATGCGEDFIKWVKLLYVQPQAEVLLNGHLQPPLFPSRGVKQGDPLSALLFLLAIEPLGNLLRAHEEHGVCLTPDHVVTSQFFADDSTLLSSSVPGMHAQLALVAVYCEGSGAKLNMTKCVALCLNRSLQCPPIPGISVLGPTDSVKYLGIPVSQAPIEDTLLDFLDQRFYDGFRQWYRRARTLKGRLLLAQTMILSRLWHYTVHVSVPPTQVKRWQSMLKRFVLSRRYERGATHFQLICDEFVYRSREDGGLQVPRLAEALHRQRIQFLQQFIMASWNDQQRSWATASVALLLLSTPGYGPRLHLDFLFINPRRHGPLIQWPSLGVWWRTTWDVWSTVKWEVTWAQLPPNQQQTYLLSVPLWFNSSSVMHYKPARRADTVSHSRCLGMVREPHRSFRQQVADSFQLRCLQDVLLPDTTWPPEDVFVARHLDYMVIDPPVFTRMQWLRRLYVELSQVFRRIQSLTGNLPILRVNQIRRIPMCGVDGVGHDHLVPRVPRTLLARLVRNPNPPAHIHPLRHHDPAMTSARIHEYTQLCKWLNKILLPVFADVQFRVAFGLLPVRSRFWFLQARDPTAIQCAQPHCQAVETERHLFFACSLAAQLWAIVTHEWGALFVRFPSWTDIATGNKPRVHDNWQTSTFVVSDLWHTLRSVILHFLWMDRNRCLFDGKRQAPTLVAVSVVYTTLSAHIRFLLRHRYSQPDRYRLLAVVGHLRKHGTFRDFFEAHPGLLSIRFAADIAHPLPNRPQTVPDRPQHQ